MKLRNFSLSVLALAGLGAVAQAQEVGRVISSTPVIHQVAVTRPVCTTEQVVAPGQKSGAGAAMGAIAGGAVGNAMGKGSGRDVATAIGIFGGAILGNKVEGDGRPEVRQVQNCTSQTFYENRTTAYNVVYEFHGKQYTVQMPSDPGPTVRLQVTPVPSGPVTAGFPPPPPATGNMVPPAGSAPVN